MSPADDYVIRIALERGLLRPDQVEAARQRTAGETSASAAVAAPPNLARQLIADGVLDASAAARAVAEEFGLPFVELGEKSIAADVLAALPRAFVLEHLVCPHAERPGALEVAMADPLDLDLLDTLAHLAGRPILAGIATEHDIRAALARCYRTEADAMEDLLASVDPARSAPPMEVRSGEAGPADATEADAPVIKLVHDLLLEAIRQRASDIHLEPLERRFRVRYRIDGVLTEAASPAKRLQPAIISRLKIMANISIAEKRVPQDGRIQVDLAGRSLDLRVSSLPTAHGESIVMRILDKENLRLGLPELGFQGDDEEQFRRLIVSPDGLVLVTGPTGSGKTTTLYGCLHHLNQPDRKIITVEDPVEYQLSGINQVPVRPDIGMTFAAALRAMLRQAPNIVMVGEIRDRETAEIAINAALTGHLVFSTLHTNDAPGAVTRLLDLGVKPFLIAAALRAAVAQRLVRRICPHCRRAYAPAAHEWRALGLTPEQADGAQFFRGAGCAACHGTGYFGRLGLFEILVINDELRGLVGASASAAQLRTRARAAGLRTLRQDAVRKVLAGHTTIEEAVSATIGDTA